MRSEVRASVSNPRCLIADFAFRSAQRGAAIIEAIIALPILIVVILGAIQFGLIYQAKATLNHASLQAARAGAVENADPRAIRRGLARGLVPIYSPPSSLEGFASTLARVNADVLANSRIQILNPTREAFADFGEQVNGIREIPNDRLHTRSTAAGAQSAVNVQDANILRLQITYGYELKVPLVNWFITRTLLTTRNSQWSAFEQQLLRRSLLPISSGATVRMHSPARLSDLVIARSDLPAVQRFPADSQPPNADEEEGDAEADAGDSSSTSGAEDSSSLGDGFFGFGEGRADPIQGGSEQSEAPEDEEENSGGSGGGASGTEVPPEEEPPLCTPAQTDTQEESSGLLGSVWNALRDMAGPAIDFVEGFWDGIKDQIGDLVHAITNPIETARGLYELAISFVEDPAGTARLIGEALGADLEQLASCGAYDRGHVIGAYVSPAFMLKLALKLARFGRVALARAVDDTKRELGCASFGPGTLVWRGSDRVPIEKVTRGSQVSSRDASSYVDSSELVVRTFRRSAPNYRFLQTESQHLAITEEHPVWVQGRGWQPVKDVEVGSVLATAIGDTVVTANSRIEDRLDVNNFAVANSKSYFVGREGLWVHNAGCQIRIPYPVPRSPSSFQIGASDGGAGAWREIPRPATDAYRYQERITGAPRGVEYNVNGVDFDGYDAQRNVLLDAKHWTQECPLGDRCRSDSLKQVMAAKLSREARDQVEAVRNSADPEMPIEWRVVDEEMALRIASILDEGLDPADRGRITVIFTPESDIVD